MSSTLLWPEIWRIMWITLPAEDDARGVWPEPFCAEPELRHTYPLRSRGQLEKKDGTQREPPMSDSVGIGPGTEARVTYAVHMRQGTW